MDINYCTAFKKSFKKLLKGPFGKTLEQDLSQVVNLLLASSNLPEKYCDHPLKGEYTGYRDCHVKPDLVLIYRKKETENILELYNIGSHSDLFG
jgi:mRNA interferase YafQ